MNSVTVITGSSTGLGYEVARALARKPNQVIVVTSRSEARANAAIAKIRSELSTKHLQTEPVLLAMPLNLGSFASIETFAARLKNEVGHWNTLVNNAGAKVEKPAKVTDEGFEWHFGVNHLGHFYLTGLLLEAAAANARVTCVSSVTAQKARAEIWNLPTAIQMQQSVGHQYAASKLANLVFAIELNRRLHMSGSTVTANAAHPGFARAEPYGPKALRLAEYIAAQSAQSGAIPIIRAAEQPADFDNAGLYFAPKIGEYWMGSKIVELPATAKPELGAELWKLSCRLTGRSWLEL